MQRIIMLLFLILIPICSFAESFASQTANTTARSWRLNNYEHDVFSNNNWVHSRKDIYSYNIVYPNAIDSTLSYTYDPASASWQPNGKGLYQYDATHEYLIEAQYCFSSGGAFTVQTLVYNNDHYLTDIYTEGIDLFEPEYGWRPQIRSHYLYENDNLSAVVEWYAGGAMASPSFTKTTFGFDELGRTIQESSYSSPDSTSWNYYGRVMRAYHPNDTSNSATFLYNLAHLPAGSFLDYSSVSHGMVSSEQDVGLFMLTYTYDEFNRILESVTLYGSNSSKACYSYNTDGNLEQVLGYVRDTASSVWRNTTRTTYTWENPTANDDHLAPAPTFLSISTFPNPFQSTMNIRVDSKSNQPVQIEVFNIRGQSVYQTEMKTNIQVTFDGKQMSSGIYFVKAKQGTETSVRKILKLK